MNRVFLIGKINRDITFTSYASGKELVKSEIVVKDYYDENRRDFIPFKVDNNQPCYEYIKTCKKGDLIYINGLLRYEKGRLYVEIENIMHEEDFNEY